MANYKEAEVAGTEWTRCKVIVIQNDYNTTPTVHFGEETILELPGGKLIKDNVGGIAFPYDPAGVINLINPLTGEPITKEVPPLVEGDDPTIEQVTMTYQDLYVALHSLYIQKATERDGV